MTEPPDHVDRPGPSMSRRRLLQGSALAGLVGLAGPGVARAATAPAAHTALGLFATAVAPAPVPPPGTLQLPLLGDGMNLDRPEYYETLQCGRRLACHTVQSGDVDGDGQDELLVRGPAGMLAYRFDADSGQWFTLPGTGPAWSDAAGWAQAHFYETIQAADLDGDGRAELIGLGPSGLEVWGYDPTAGTWVNRKVENPLSEEFWTTPWYYSTIQCADIDGDGQAELLARGPDGMRVWSLSGTSWRPGVTNSFMQDSNNWTNPSYYRTLQCADVNGDGSPELIGRDDNGLHAFRYDNGWSEIATPLTALGTASGWALPQYYSTIQCADIDGDRTKEVVGRGPNGILAWKLVSGAWTSLPAGPALSDADGWDSPEYYTTIQFADLDGDLSEELVVRSSTGIRAWSFGRASWTPLEIGPEWSDASGWNEVQYYSTIRTARVHGSAANAHNPAPLLGRAAVLLGRSATSVLSYRYQPTGWTVTSAPWPALDPTAYDWVGRLLGLAVGVHVRDLYNDDSAVLDGYLTVLRTSPPPPTGYPGTAGAWTATVTQLTNELGWVLLVQSWYADIGQLMTDTFAGEDVSLSAVAGVIQMKESTDTIGVAVASLLFNIAWAVMGAFAPVASAAAGVLSSAVGALAANWGDSDTLEGTVAQLDTQLVNIFAAAVASTANQQLAVTGGLANGETVIGDYGLLAAVGRQRSSGAPAWTWSPTDAATMMILGQQSFAVSAWQSLEPVAQWRWSVRPDGWTSDPAYDEYLTNGWVWSPTSTTNQCDTYFMVQYQKDLGIFSAPTLINPDVLQQLFDPVGPGFVFPLGVSPADVIGARHGWPQVSSTITSSFLTGCSHVTGPYVSAPIAGAVGASALSTAGSASKTGAATTPAATPSTPTAASSHSRQGAPPTPNRRPSTGIDLGVTARLKRDTAGQVVVWVTVSDHGLTPARNVELVDAKLAARPATGHVPTRRRRIDDGEAVTFHLRFTDVRERRGTSVRLQVKGRHADGQFTQVLDVVLP
jgi:hypothetical protein